MKARKIILSTVVLSGFALILSGQTVNTSLTPGGSPVMSEQQAPSTDAYKKETIIPEKKPVPYSYLREADVMWAKDVWRTIDLRQRMNFPLRYPIQGKMSGGDRYSLFGLLMEGIETEEITPYEYVLNIGWNDPFSKITTLSAIYESTDADSTINPEDQSFTGEVEHATQNLMQFRIQEQWYFDKKHSTMNVRILAIAPVFFFEEEKNGIVEIVQEIPFIVHFPQCRRLFATHAVYNPKNDAQPISYDDLFFQRRFASTIIGESNVYGNRQLNTYKTGQDILLEAEKIKNDLFIMEHDLWEY